MMKRISAVLLALCMLFGCIVYSSAAEPSDAQSVCCLHENSEWKLLVPPTLITDSYYQRVCPDCGMKQTAKKARTSFIVMAFDRLARLFFLFDNYTLSDDFTVTAHTGPGEIPQNSKFSLDYSLATGANTVEFDLALDSEGVAVLAHGSEDEAEMTLDEAFAKVASYYGTTVNVDVKNKEAVSQAQECAIKYGILDRIFYTGVPEHDVGYVREHSPLVPYYINISASADPADCARVCDRVLELGAIGLNFNYNDYSPELAQAARERGLKLSVYTVNSLKDMRTVLDCDVDNITTEFPYKLYTVTNSLTRVCGCR